MNRKKRIPIQKPWTNVSPIGRTLIQRLQGIADQMDEAIADGATADEAEAMAIEQIQKLGGEMLAHWAEAKQQQALKQAQATHPESIKHIKKSNLVYEVWCVGSAGANATLGSAGSRTASFL